MANALIADFQKRFPGARIHGQLNQPADGHSITILFGPSGCGKTTVLRCLAGLETPEEGTIQFGDALWFSAERKVNLPPQQRGIGFVFQDYALFPHLTVAGNVEYGLRGLTASERRKRVGELLERFELGSHAGQRPRQLSGGQQQRVAVARALAGRPKLLLLDEPLSALDAALREQLRGELRQILARSGIPVLLVTHDRDEAIALGDELVVMARGEVRQSGAVLDVFNRPADAEVAQIVRVENLHAGCIIERSEGLVTVEVGTGRLIALAPKENVREVIVCIRGEDVALQRQGSSSSSVRNSLAARIVAIHPGSPLTRIELEAGFRLFALVTRPACEELGLRPGVEVTALIKAPAVHLIPRGPGGGGDR